MAKPMCLVNLDLVFNNLQTGHLHRSLRTPWSRSLDPRMTRHDRGKLIRQKTIASVERDAHRQFIRPGECR
ncbi:BQ5605_C030g10799 [Microbotryum silenes-dioicae]|uniref:BQ5605_C030g10799 protein n=1 Tax=Microbotryum silenes-dioicae TaxID=796604 RepID=A0A2X0MI42_9BASI|nr:BQ5605_C030g10799 [Microbotryum silenes-dioicae]